MIDLAGLNDLVLMRLHVAALFTSDVQGCLLAVNEPRGGPAPRIFLGRTAAGNLWWVRNDVSPKLADLLRATCEDQPPGLEPPDGRCIAALDECLARAEPVTKTWTGPAYLCTTRVVSSEAAIRVSGANVALLSPLFEDWRPDAEAGLPMTVVERDGRAVSVCCSVRVTAEAHEAGVETHPDYRGHGYAGRAVAGWAQAVREMGCVPLYSTSWANLASQATARKLGLRQFGSDVYLQ